MKNNLLLEVERNLTLMGISKKVNLINEGRGEFSNRIWSLILGVGDNTPSVIKKRSNNISIILNNTGLNLNTLRKNEIKSGIEKLISANTNIEEVLIYMEKELTPSVVEKIEKKLSSLGLLDNQIIKSLISDLSDKNSDLSKGFILDVNQELNKFINDERFVNLSPSNKIKSLDDFKQILASTYSSYFGVGTTPKNVIDLVDGVFQKEVDNINTSSEAKTIFDNKKQNIFSSDQSTSSNNSIFMFNETGTKGYYQVLSFSKFPDEFYDYVSSLGKDLESEVMDYLINRTYIEASGEFNRVHFREGIHPKLQGIGLGYTIYRDFINFLGYASSSDNATVESKRVWEKLFDSSDYYGVYGTGDNVLIVNKNWVGDIESLFKSFISKKCQGNDVKINNSFLSDYPEFSVYLSKNVNELYYKLKNKN
jgi:hypothetical protein